MSMPGVYPTFRRSSKPAPLYSTTSAACSFGDRRGGLAQHFAVGTTERGDLARGAVNGFLCDVAGVALDPLPLDLVTGGGAVEPRPPLVVRLAPEASRHRLDDVARVGHHAHAARLAQLFESERGGGDLRLLVRRVPQIQPERAPHAAEPQQRDRRRARLAATVAEA